MRRWTMSWALKILIPACVFLVPAKVFALACNAASVAASTANGTYSTGTIAVTVTFNIAVTVVGTPQLLMESGATNRQANYASGSGTTVLTFNYVIVSGDASADLDYVATNSLTLNGGTIKNAATCQLPANASNGTDSI